MTKIKVYACYTVKIYKNKPLIFFKKGGGGAPGAPVLDPPLIRLSEVIWYELSFKQFFNRIMLHVKMTLFPQHPIKVSHYVVTLNSFVLDFSFFLLTSLFKKSARFSVESPGLRPSFLWTWSNVKKNLTNIIWIDFKIYYHMKHQIMWNWYIYCYS